VTTPNLIDYYKVLAVPPDADLIGIENAYVRLSDELVKHADDDDETDSALARLNEAYTVLANPETRRKYDRLLFSAEYEALERRLQAEVRRRRIARNIIVGALMLVVLGQAAALAYLGRDIFTDGLAIIPGIVFGG
jgi:curved DNA-binding protein CbpA